jgi:hypothetical protein
MANFFKSVFWLVMTIASLVFIYFFWTGAIPETVKGTPTPSGMAMRLKITGTRSLPWVGGETFKTTLYLDAPDGETFSVFLDELGSRAAVEKLTSTMRWEDDNTLSFRHDQKNKLIIVSYRAGLWNLHEERFASL